MTINKKLEIILNTSPQSEINIEDGFKDETFGLSEKQIAELFGVEVTEILKHQNKSYLTLLLSLTYLNQL